MSKTKKTIVNTFKYLKEAGFLKIFKYIFAYKTFPVGMYTSEMST